MNGKYHLAMIWRESSKVIEVMRKGKSDEKRGVGILILKFLLKIGFLLRRPRSNSIDDNSLKKKLYCQASADSIDASYGEDSYTIFDECLMKTPDYINILEIGCSMGHFSNYCYNMKKSIIFTDISESNIKLAKKNYPNLSFCVADAEKLPFKDNSFDVVVSIELIEHLFNQRSHLFEVNRILKTNGIYIIKTPNKLYDRIVNFPYYMFIYKMKYHDLKLIHPSSQSYFGLKHILTHHGFNTNFLSIGQLSQIQRQKLEKMTKYTKFIEKIIFSFFPLSLQPSLFCVATKSTTVARRLI